MLIWVCSFSTQLGLFNYYINLSPVTREDIALLCANHELGGYGPLILQDAGPLGKACVCVGLVLQIGVQDQLLHRVGELASVPPQNLNISDIFNRKCLKPTLTVPSDEAVKNSDPVLLDIHMVLKTGSVWEADRGISPTGLPPVLKYVGVKRRQNLCI